MRAVCTSILIALSPNLAQSEELTSTFESALFLWVASSARLDFCTTASETPGKVRLVLDEAEEAFHPGMFDWFARRKFRDDMDFMAEKGAFQGKLDYRDKGCFQVDLLERVGRQTVESIIETQARRR